MASVPKFASAPRMGIVAVSTANTARDGTGTLLTVITGTAAGVVVPRIAVVATGDPADSIVTLFISDGTTTWLFDEFDIGNPVAASTTVPGYKESRRYPDLMLNNASWLIKAGITVAPTSGVVNVIAHGQDLA